MKVVILALALAAAAVTVADAQAIKETGSRSTARQAPSLAGDPFKVLYRISGFRDSGGAANEGLASAIACTNFSQTTESLRIGVYDGFGAILSNSIYSLPPRGTNVFATRPNTSFGSMTLAASSPLPFGFAVISASTTNLHCSAMVINVGVAGQGFALHMVRFNPHAGSVE